MKNKTLTSHNLFTFHIKADLCVSEGLVLHRLLAVSEGVTPILYWGKFNENAEWPKTIWTFERSGHPIIYANKI